VPSTSTGVETAAAYGISEALLAAHPELRKVYELFKADNIGAALEELFKTEYYRNTGSTVKTREKLKLEQPQVYVDNVVKYKLAARKRLVESGIRVDTATFDKIMEDAYARGLNEDQVDQAVINSSKVTGYGGEILGDTNSLKFFAAEMGVGSLYGDKYWTQKSRDLFLGTTTITDVQEEIKKLSASAYPAYADGIMSGKSLQTLNTNVIRTISEDLEIDEDMAMKHPVYKQIMGYKDPETNAFAIMPQWLVERTIRNTTDFPFTKKALQLVDTIGMRPLEEFGLMA